MKTAKRKKTEAQLDKEALRPRTARELARMFAKGKGSRYGSPVVDGLGLIDEECLLIAWSLRKFAARS